MGKGIAWLENGVDVLVLDGGVLRFYLLDALLTQSDIEYFQFTNELLVFGK